VSAEAAPIRARQLFAPGADAVFRLALLIAAASVVGLFLVAGALSTSSYVTGVGVAPDQPVPFSHKHHAGELGIDCRYCHQTVTQLATAGLPPTWTCMTCHSQIWKNAPMLEPVRASLKTDQPLVWTRVNRLPSYVYFNHSIHLAKGVGCSSCHGNMKEMQLTAPAHGFQMAFCLNCHRHPEKYVRQPGELFDMEWTPPANQGAVGPALVARYHIGQSEKLTDCSICHR
jgi:hypothetical protein